MTIAIEARTVENTIAHAGAPRRFSRLKRAGNTPSCAAARGISAVIIVHPFSAPMPEMITTAAMTLPQKVPPNMSLIAVENGAVELCRASLDTIPKTATSDRM
jgi:hypothetical protein